jgi:all-trans-retinol 13,14-reductase
MDNRFDIVVIGSGLGGLLSSAILSKNGYNVLLLEKNAQVGGCLQSYYRDGALFETGVHYIGGLDSGQTLNRIFSYIGLLPALKLSRLDLDGFDIIRFGNNENKFAYAQSYEGFIDTLSSSFPKERAGIEGFCEYMKGICRRFPLYNLESGNFLDKLEMLEINARETINSFVSDPILQNVLAANNLLYAGVGEKTPFYIHALIFNSYIESAWRCVEGGKQMASLLSDIIQANGGTIITSAEVSRIVAYNGQVTKVETTDQREFEGKFFISDLHPSNTIAMTQTDVFRKAYINRITELENSVGAFILNVAFRKESFPYLNHNVYYYSDPTRVWQGTDYQLKKWPENYAFFVGSGKDGYSRSASIMSYMRFSELEPWVATYNTVSSPSSRGDGYEEFKEQKAQLLFDLVERTNPGFRSSVKAYHTLTPLSFRDHTGTPSGSLYGVLRDCNEPLKTFIPARTKIPNLLLTGQNLNVHGILGVTVSSLVTCGELIGIESLLEKIRRN